MTEAFKETPKITKNFEENVISKSVKIFSILVLLVDIALFTFHQNPLFLIAPALIISSFFKKIKSSKSFTLRFSIAFYILGSSSWFFHAFYYPSMFHTIIYTIHSMTSYLLCFFYLNIQASIMFYKDLTTTKVKSFISSVNPFNESIPPTYEDVMNEI